MTTTLPTLDDNSQVVAQRLAAAFELTDSEVTIRVEGQAFSVTVDEMTYRDAHDGEHCIVDLITVAADRNERRVDALGEGLYVARKG